MPNETYPVLRFQCQECGELVTAQQKHDYTACIAYRWHKAPRDGSPGAEKAQLNQAERDIDSLIARIRELEEQLAAARRFVAKP